MAQRLTLSFQGDSFARFTEAVEKLGSERDARTAFRRAVNHVGDKTRTQVRRALAEQTGLTQGALKTHGGFDSTRATSSSLAYTISAKGRPIALRHFGAKQLTFGVSAKPWGRSQRFKGAFIFAGTLNSGKLVDTGGNVWHRRTSASLPIEKMFGPAVPEELVKGKSAAAFEKAAAELPKRFDHEVSVMTAGIVTRG